MPDVASSDKAHHASTLDWVGMGQMSLPVVLAEHGVPTPIPGKVQCYVNLNNGSVKGIHMSRLYLLLTEFAGREELTPASLNIFIAQMLQSHADISNQASIIFDFPLLLKRQALKSHYSGWKSYPCSIEARLNNGQISLIAKVTVAYSSTCPCSAALARQMVENEFHHNFQDQEMVPRATVEQWLRSEKGSYATPHSQRSEAYVEYKLEAKRENFGFESVINALEAALGTPVQTAVKREDEQEFARLNGHNLMFCEDAARRINHCLKQMPFVDFKAKVSHYESLHAHDAISMTSKGVAGGMAW